MEDKELTEFNENFDRYIPKIYEIHIETIRYIKKTFSNVVELKNYLIKNKLSYEMENVIYDTDNSKTILYVKKNS